MPTSQDPAEVGSQPAAAGDVHLASIHNFRDLAGAGLHTPDGPLRRRFVFRSNVIAPSEADARTIAGLGLRRIIDLRTPGEVDKHPDAEIAGAEYRNIDVLGAATSAATILGYDGDATPDKARVSLRATYESFVRDAAFRSRLTPVFEAVAQSPGPVVIHCTAGKDRTGFVSAALQLLAGVGRAEVMDNYLETNERSRAWVAEMAELFHARVPERAAALIELLQVREEYLDTAMDAIESGFGGIDGYFRDGLGMDPQAVAQLRRSLLEQG